MSVPVPLPARTNASELARYAVQATTAAAMSVAGVVGPARIDPERVAIAFSSERWLRINGSQPVAFAPLSAFFAAQDGWVRTHANYPHHRAALLRALGLPDGATRDDVASIIRALGARRLSATIVAEGGLCVRVREEDAETDAAWRRTPLVGTRRLGDAPPRQLPDPKPSAPLRGIRVLDLTRVIAGPVATRTLGFLGAEVLRIDPAHLPEISAQHVDTGHGKRSAVLDLRSAAGRQRMERLLDGADIIALGYRPAALARLGFDPAAIAARHPGIIVLRLSAWGDDAGERRVFDSLVQAESGIALIEASSDRPGALPAQALDHGAGYLLAAAAIDLLRRRRAHGGSWLAETSLRRIAAELLGLPRVDSPAGSLPQDPTGHTQTFTVAGAQLTTAGPAVSYPGGPTAFAPPRPWGQDDPAWS